MTWERWVVKMGEWVWWEGWDEGVMMEMGTSTIISSL